MASLKLNDVTYTKCKDKPTILNDYFTSAFTKEDESNIPPLDGCFFPDILPIDITIEGVTTLLSNLEVHKANGPDEIPLKKSYTSNSSCFNYNLSGISLSILNPS